MGYGSANQTVQGAFGGAGTGAAVGGAIGGPIGAGIGAGAGALLGGLGSFFGGGDSWETKRKKALYDQIQNRGAPQADFGPNSQYSDFRSNQANLIAHLEAMSNGQGPSLAAQQLKAATDRNIANQQALAQSGQGNATAGAFQAANNSAQLGAQAAQDSASARIAEQQMALSQLGQNINFGRSSDETTNRFNIEQANQMRLANLDAQLKTMGYNDQARAAILGLNNGGGGGPGLGSSLLAGGAGALGQYLNNRAQQRNTDAQIASNEKIAALQYGNRG